MKIHAFNIGNFKLDGGAMFGVVPKVLWSKQYPSDENNLCDWALRTLLIEDGDRLILIDNGLGHKQEEKFYSHYHLSGTHNIEKSLNELGFSCDDITDMFLTHLHFDHCGGGIIKDEKGSLKPLFKNAKYWTNKEHFDWATNPNPREKASFLKENILPMQESGQLHFLNDGEYLTPNFQVMFCYGHTHAMMVPLIKYQNRNIAFMADLIPAAVHVPVAWVIGYDTRPLESVKEKTKFLNKAVAEDFILYFQHDALNECCTVMKTEKGIRVKEKFKFQEVFK